MPVLGNNWLSYIRSFTNTPTTCTLFLTHVQPGKALGRDKEHPYLRNTLTFFYRLLYATSQARLEVGSECALPLIRHWDVPTSFVSVQTSRWSCLCWEVIELLSFTNTPTSWQWMCIDDDVITTSIQLQHEEGGNSTHILWPRAQGESASSIFAHIWCRCIKMGYLWLVHRLLLLLVVPKMDIPNQQSVYKLSTLCSQITCVTSS